VEPRSALKLLYLFGGLLILMVFLGAALYAVFGER
jgi:hypothetical protein